MSSQGLSDSVSKVSLELIEAIEAAADQRISTAETKIDERRRQILLGLARLVPMILADLLKERVTIAGYLDARTTVCRRLVELGAIRELAVDAYGLDEAGETTARQLTTTITICGWLSTTTKMTVGEMERMKTGSAAEMLPRIARLDEDLAAQYAASNLTFEALIRSQPLDFIGFGPTLAEASDKSLS